MNARKWLLSGSVVLAVAGAPAAAHGQDSYVSNTTETVLGTTVTRPAVRPQVASQSLPVTGGDLVGLTALGVAALAAGTVMVRRTKRAGRVSAPTTTA